MYTLIMAKLTAISIKQLKKTGRYSDGNGLYLQVRATNNPDSPNKSWIFRWGAGGKNSMGLGTLKDVSLAQARDLAASHHRTVSAGGDPRQTRDKLKLEAKLRQEAITFEVATKGLIESQQDGWKSKKHVQQWANTLATYANPVIGTTPCAEVTTEQVLNILKPIWTTKTETATRVRSRIESVLDWAAAIEDRSGENPARWKGKLKIFLPAISKRRRVTHHSALPYPQVPAMFTAIGANPSLSAKALLFCVLTATRTSETIEASWSEIDFENQLWIIPKARMKREREHRVPLSAQAVALLKTISRKGDSPWVFNGQSRTKKHAPLSNMAMLNYLQETLNYPNFTVHGFRSSFRDWAAETTDHKREVIEQALSHQLADQAEAAYQRGDYMEKRKLLMKDWADYCFGVGAEPPVGAPTPQPSGT
jgi:integrase